MCFRARTKYTNTKRKVSTLPSPQPPPPPPPPSSANPSYVKRGMYSCCILWRPQPSTVTSSRDLLFRIDGKLASFPTTCFGTPYFPGGIRRRWKIVIGATSLRPMRWMKFPRFQFTIYPIPELGWICCSSHSPGHIESWFQACCPTQGRGLILFALLAFNHPNKPTHAWHGSATIRFSIAYI